MGTKEGKAAVDMKTAKGQNVLHVAVAAKVDVESSVDCILSSDGGPRLLLGQDEDGSTPLHLAVVKRMPSGTIERFLSAKEGRMSLKSVDRNGRSAVSLAAEKGTTEQMELFLGTEEGREVLSPDKDILAYAEGREDERAKKDMVDLVLKCLNEEPPQK